MKQKVIAYKSFCWLYIIMGIIHELIVIPQHLSTPPEHIQNIVNQMKEVVIFNSSLYNFFVGYDLLIGMFFIAYGYLNKILLTELGIELFRKKGLNTLVLSLNIMATLISIQFFFFLPIIITSLASVLHLYSFYTKEVE